MPLRKAIGQIAAYGKANNKYKKYQFHSKFFALPCLQSPIFGTLSYYVALRSHIELLKQGT